MKKQFYEILFDALSDSVYARKKSHGVYVNGKPAMEFHPYIKSDGKTSPDMSFTVTVAVYSVSDIRIYRNGIIYEYENRDLCKSRYSYFMKTAIDITNALYGQR